MNRKENYRDLDHWRATKRKQKRRYYGRTINAENSGMRWTEQEINMVLEHKLSDMELSNVLGRSVNAIQKMRHRMKVEQEDES